MGEHSSNLLSHQIFHSQIFDRCLNFKQLKERYRLIYTDQAFSPHDSILMNILCQSTYIVENFASCNHTAPSRERKQITVAVNKIDFWISSGNSKLTPARIIQRFKHFLSTVQCMYMRGCELIFLLKSFENHLRFVNALGFNCFLLVIFHFS